MSTYPDILEELPYNSSQRDFLLIENHRNILIDRKIDSVVVQLIE